VISGAPKSDRRPPTGILLVAAVVIAFVVVAPRIGQGGLAGSAAGPTATVGASSIESPGASTSGVPSVAPTPSVLDSSDPSAPASGESAASQPAGNGDCGRISPAACTKAITLARKGHGADVAGATRVVVDDACPPTTLCDRRYPFDAVVVFVTAGADTTGWYYYEVVGLEDNQPTKVQPLQGELPAHIVAQLRAPQPTP
jgi:hypothetical protein